MNDLHNQLVKLGSAHPELREHIRPILADMGKEAYSPETMINTALDDIASISSQQMASLFRWRDIAPNGSLSANHALQAQLSAAEKSLREARKLVRKAEGEIKRLEGAARRSL